MPFLTGIGSPPSVNVHQTDATQAPEHRQHDLTDRLGLLGARDPVEGLGVEVDGEHSAGLDGADDQPLLDQALERHVLRWTQLQDVRDLVGGRPGREFDDDRLQASPGQEVDLDRFEADRRRGRGRQRAGGDVGECRRGGGRRRGRGVELEQDLVRRDRARRCPRPSGHRRRSSPARAGRGSPRSPACRLGCRFIGPLPCGRARPGPATRRRIGRRRPVGPPPSCVPFMTDAVLGDEGESQPGADPVAGGAATGEAFEDAIAFARGDAGSGVLDRQPEPIRRRRASVRCGWHRHRGSPRCRSGCREYVRSAPCRVRPSSGTPAATTIGTSGAP